MSKIFLINFFGNPVSPSSFNPDNSLAALAGNLKRAGYSPEIIDYQNIDFAEKFMPKDIGKKIFEIVSEVWSRVPTGSEVQELKRLNQSLLVHQTGILNSEITDLTRRIENEKPLFAGFKIYSGEGAYFNKMIASELKKKVKVPLLAGGPLIRVIGNNFLSLYPEFDYIINGEADRSIVSFADFICGKVSCQNVPGLSSSTFSNAEDSIKDLNELADPCYDKDVYPILYEENKKTLIFQIDESRGCPNSCNFCVHPTLNESVFRVVKPERVVKQIKYLQSNFGAAAFRFTGSNTPKKFLCEFADLVIQEGLNIKYSCYASINTTTNDEIVRLKKSGLAGVFIGVETTDQNILINAFNKKGQNLKRVKSLLKTCLENGIYTTTSWIYPMPGYSEAVRDEMRDFISDVYKGYTTDDGSVMVVPSGLLPNTEWFNNPEKYGFKIENKQEYYKGYAELNLRFWLPRSLNNDWNYSMNGQSFMELSAECDVLIRELTKNKVPLGVTDDWMLQGKFSGISMDEFKTEMIKSFLTGDYEKISEMVKTINRNSRLYSLGATVSEKRAS